MFNFIKRFSAAFRASALPSISVSNPGAVQYFGGGWGTNSGIEVTEDNALRLATVYACVNVISQSMAQIPWHLYKRNGENGGKERATTHPLYSLLRQTPNPKMTAFQFKQLVISQLLQRGNSFSQIVRDKGGRISEIWPWPSNSVRIEQDGWNLKYFFKIKDGAEAELPESNVLHLRGLSANGLLGLSPIGACRETIGEGLASQKIQGKFFKDGWIGKNYIASKKQVSEKARKNILDSFDEKFSGSDNAWKMFLLDDEMEMKNLGISLADAQFLENRKFNRSEIAGIFRVPPHMIGDLERATFTNIENQSQNFTTFTLLPWATNLCDQIALTLLSPWEREEYYAEFMFADLLKGDTNTRWNTYGRGIQWGIISPNEARAMENLNPREGGDIYLTPVNMAVDGKLLDGGANTDENTEKTDGNNENTDN